MLRNAPRVALVVLVLLLGACGDDDAAAPSATVANATTTTAPQITAEYLNEVIAALDHIDGDAFRLIVRDRAIKPEALDLLKSIYEVDEFEAQLDLLASEVQKELPNATSDPGDRKTSIKRILDERAACVFVEVERDYNALRVEPAPPFQTYLALRRAEDTLPNVTGWRFLLEGRSATGAPPENPCAS